MEDWSKIRMSDEEFIKGIYEKANKYQEQERADKKSKGSHQSVITSKWLSLGLSAAAACTLIVLGAVRLLPIVNKMNVINETDNALYRPVEDEMEQNTKIAPEPKEIQPKLVTGTIKGNDQLDLGPVLEVEVSDEDTNGLSDIIHVMITEQLEEDIIKYQEEHGMETIVGKQAAMYLVNYNFQGYFKVNTNESFFIQELDAENEPIYINMDGDKLEDIK